MIKRYLWLIFGTLLMGFGIECIVKANSGSDSVSTLIMGLLNYSIIPFGRWSQIISCIMVTLTFFGDKKLLGIGSVVNSLLLGQSILYFDSLLQNIFIPIYGPILALIGFTIMAFGTALYLKSELGAGPMECVMLLLKNKYGISIKKSRILIDFSIIVVGVLFGAPFGIGTIFAIFLLGPFIEFFIKLFHCNEKKRFL